MFKLIFTDEEKELLIDVLKNDISDLRMQIADTDNMDFRNNLKRHEEILGSILVKLQQSEETTQGE